ncbi:DUF5682 family protein [Saccharibacillus sp. JS10]|uniref:DUF5682 family protein n=1 Tax=Saccharibacillus sp. JS10 TaxID=2950552 RepID=UPI00210BFE07|nr:DUF5682 family protein [Saccharibacillus sp. JS10]MCQ4087391.1 DUF5682 family protein [Saccharibacillus sp. JS10]
MDRLNPVVAVDEETSSPEIELSDLKQQFSKLHTWFEEKVFDLRGPVVHFPIRHHSPACSYHLLRTIEEYAPDLILIEGPESGNPLIPVLADPATQAPVSLYYGYEDESGRGSCYFPMLDYSPEYIGIREAAKRQIPARFIDLDYRGRQREASENGKSSAQDEALLAGSDFIRRLCQATKTRHFDEWWEKSFEVGGLSQDTREFARGVFTYCTLSRMTYSAERLKQEGDLEREARMRTHIEEARAAYKRILVVTGGFHTYGLITDPTGDKGHLRQQEAGGEEIRKQMYPMVFTFEEADRLNGYASGMPYVGYYDKVWASMLKGEAKPYERTGLEMLTTLSKTLRTEAEAASTADGIEAYGMMQGLAALRSKSQSGAYELIDGVTVSFIKGERTLASDHPLEKLHQLMTGNQIGQVAPNSFAVPIVEDFKKRAAASRLNLKATGQHRKVLEIYTKPVHREASRLLHCAAFLGSEFAKRESGPDWAQRQDLNRMREIWTYSYSSRTEARLIENSIYGGTIAEAAEARIEEEVSKIPIHHSGDMAAWLLRSLTMGLEQLAASLFDNVQNALRQDGSFLSLCDTLDIVEQMISQRRLLGVADENRLRHLADEAYAACISRIPSLNGLNTDEQPRAVEGLKLLEMHAAGRAAEQRTTSAASDADENFRDRLSELLAVANLAPRLEGAAIAILVRIADHKPREITDRARAYLHGSPDQVSRSAEYLQGVFAVARDILMQSDVMLADLSQLLARLPHEDFLRLLPELRLAFTFFTPPETSRIAAQVAKLHGLSASSVQQQAVSERSLLAAKQLDQAIREEFAAWKLD